MKHLCLLFFSSIINRIKAIEDTKKFIKSTTTNADLSAYIRKRLTYRRTGERNHAMTKALLAFRRKSKSLHTQREKAS